VRTVHRGAALRPDGRIVDTTLVFQDRAVVEVRSPVAGDPSPLPGLLIPGLVNAHTHLELSGVGLVAGGHGLPAWVGALMAQRGHATEPSAPAAAARDLHERLGAAAVSDICAQGDTGGLIAAAGLSGIAQNELIGFDRVRADAGIQRAATLDNLHRYEHAVVRSRPAPHAPYSTAPDLLQACLAPRGGAPASLHLAEDPEETAFLIDGVGAFAELLDRLGVDWRWFAAPGVSPVAYLHALGGLGPGTLVVHAVWTDAADRARLAATQTPVCLCVRSNLHIGGCGPDVAGLLAAGVPLCLGTDSLASSPDLDVLGELPVLCDLAPDVPVATWLALATRGGAHALGLPGLGALQVGRQPGLLHLDTDLSGLTRGAPDRAWRVLPGDPGLELR
jgi:cytosine/adenosine deaminase-related metal-dependent hydrolase